MKIYDGSSWNDSKGLKIYTGSGWSTPIKVWVFDNGWKLDNPSLPESTAGPTFTYTGKTNPAVGATFTANSTWRMDGSYAPTSYAYQWKRNNVDISGATTQTYLSTTSDVDKVLSVSITATNSTGSTTITGGPGYIILPIVETMSAYEITETPAAPIVSLSYSGLTYSGSFTQNANYSYGVSTNNGSVTRSGNQFSGSGSSGSATVYVTATNSNKQVYMLWSEAPGATSYDVVKYGNTGTTTINVPSTQRTYTWSIADGNEGNYFTIYPRSANYQGYGIQNTVTTSNKSATGSATVTIGCTAGWVDADWTYGGVTWSGNCSNNSESGTYSWRYRMYGYADCTEDNIIEYGSYGTSRYCVPTCTAGWVDADYTYNVEWSGTCGSNSLEGGTSAGRTRTYRYADCSTALITEQGPFYQTRACTYVACVCNYSAGPTDSYHFAPECCPGGSQRAGSLSGTTTNACCPNVSRTASGKYTCKEYDVSNSASSNYYTCYSVGACDASYNSDGSRATCYL